MGRKKRAENPYSDFDVLNPYADKSFFQMYHSQITSPAYMALSDGAKVLLLICKDVRRYSTAGRQGEFYPNAPRNDPKCFYLNRALLRMYGGGWSSPNKARRCLIELVQYGFIEVVELGTFTRTKNIYRFSGRWKKLGEGQTVELKGLDKTFCTIQKKGKS